MKYVQAGAHRFRPLRWWDRLWAFGRCSHCLLPRDAHPVGAWTPARPWGDRRSANYETAIPGGGFRP
jgi:hypothetical protein